MCYLIPQYLPRLIAGSFSATTARYLDLFDSDLESSWSFLLFDDILVIFLFNDN